MTNTDELARMAKEFNQALEAVHDYSSSFGGLLKVQVLEMKASVLMNAYSRALAQATEVADENFERAQKLADQVQENVKHIERMAQQIKTMGEYMESRGFVILRNSGGQVEGIADRRTRHE